MKNLITYSMLTSKNKNKGDDNMIFTKSWETESTNQGKVYHAIVSFFDSDVSKIYCICDMLKEDIKNSMMRENLQGLRDSQLKIELLHDLIQLTKNIKY